MHRSALAHAAHPCVLVWEKSHQAGRQDRWSCDSPWRCSTLSNPVQSWRWPGRDQKTLRGPPPALSHLFLPSPSSAQQQRPRGCSSLPSKGRVGWCAGPRGLILFPVKAGDKPPRFVRGHPPSPQLWRLSGHSTVPPPAPAMALCVTQRGGKGFPRGCCTISHPSPAPGNAPCWQRAPSGSSASLTSSRTSRHHPEREDNPPPGGCCPQPSLPARGSLGMALPL